MATLYITEFSNQGTDSQGRPVGACVLPPIAQQAIAITAGSVQSATLNAQTTMVRLHADTGASVELALNPTATTAKMRLPVDCVEYFGVPLNSGLKIATIAN